MGEKRTQAWATFSSLERFWHLIGRIRVSCLTPSRAEDGLCCRPVQLFHCYWSVENPRNRHRRILQGGWFLAGGGPKLCGVQSHAGEGYRLLCYHPATGYLGGKTIKGD